MKILTMLQPEQIQLNTLPYVITLSSKYLLKEILENFYRFDLDKLKELVFIDLRRNNPTLPDYIYKSVLKEKLGELTNFSDVILNSFENLSDYIYWYRNNIYVKDGFLEEWQNILTLVPPLGIISHFLFENKINRDFLVKFFNDKYSTLPSEFSPEIENLLCGKLIELHLHLNGTSEVEHIWIDALKNPFEVYKEIKKSYNQKEVQELYKQFDINFSAESLYKLLVFAKRIREVLVCKLKNLKVYVNEKDILPIKDIKYVSILPTFLPYPYKLHPYEIWEKCENALTYESLFFYDSFAYISQNPNSSYSKLFYVYILLKSVLNRLLTQQIDQYGFDQFQKITLTGIREFSEKDYKIRFLQLNSLYNNQLKHLEGRFAPKSDFKRLKNLVDKIISDYENLKGQNKINYSFSIVAHFIKKPDKRSPEGIITYRHYKLRQELKKQAINLWNLIRWNPKKYLRYIRGIDAAANELHASPEVFAPAFRFLKRRLRDLPNFYKEDIQPNLGITFHAGEDFIHIISGIRYIFEAITFLKMSKGDRIGHATAIGIDPKIWVDKIGKKLKIKKGEWLDNLIFTYLMLREEKDFYHLTYIIEKEIEKYFYEIYKIKDKITINNIIEAYLCRAIDPEVIFQENKFYVYHLEEEEKEFKKILGFQPDKISLNIYRHYHRGDTIKSESEFTEVIVDNHFSIEIIEFLQKKLIKLLNSKGIAIEAMPTSNLRISFYEKYTEHHIYRWMYSFEEKPQLVICSDDPGIFSTTLKNEFLLIFKELPKDKHKNLIEDFLKTSEIYKF